MKKLYLLGGLIVLVLVLFAVGYRQKRNAVSNHRHAEKSYTSMETHAGETETAGRKIQFWTCPMHSQIKLPDPGQCPICFMDLTPVYEDAEEEDTARITLTETARNLAAIETAAVAHRELSVEIRLPGIIDYDETKTANISAWIPGRVDKLYVNFTGAPVEKGQPLFRIYSPELRTAQYEYLIALNRYKEALERTDVQDISSSKQVMESVKKKLELWGILPGQIKEIEEKGEPADNMDFYSPASGIITERSAFEGMYFKTGDTLFRVADLSTLWIQLDAYEKDLQHIHAGQKAEISTDVYQGETFTGTVVFIDPFIDDMKRTGRVRIEVKNPDNKLKPGMFSRAILRKNIGRQLSIPCTAPLLTGKRAVVYVEIRENVFEGREVVLGPRAGDFYLVVSGLKMGEKVVTRGNFKIDASLQIRGEPGMMQLMEEAHGKTAAPAAPVQHHH